MEVKLFSLIFLCAFSIFSFIDGVYIHLYKYRLHENKNSKREHFLHTIRAVFFFLILLFIYYYEASGFWLYLGCGIVIIDYGVESIDMFEEKTSRNSLGGLSSFEYWLHGTLVMLRSLSLGLWFSTFTYARFFLNEASLSVTHNVYYLFVIKQLMISTFLVAGLHILLILKPNFFKVLNIRCCGLGELN